MHYDVIVIGSGFGSLTSAALLSKHGLNVCVLEQAKYPGGCATSYKRKGHRFETGATTLVGLDEHMPLHYLLNETGIEIPGLRKLDKPMQVHLPNGAIVTRYQHLEEWIAEAERVFGTYNQRKFWEHCYRISKQVWQVSLRQRTFPFSSAGDLLQAAGSFRPWQLTLLPAAFTTIEDLLRKYKLLDNQLFVDFVNEQLLITAQNYIQEVNVLFGATALCYTLFGNYYVDGGLINLVQPVVDYCREKGASIKYGQEVTSIKPIPKGYTIATNKGTYTSRFIVSGIPLNNTVALFEDEKLSRRLQKYVLSSEKLNGAFTMSLVLNKQPRTILHHQVHLPQGLPIINSKSIFISFSHNADNTRAKEGEQVAGISTHIQDPANTYVKDKAEIEKAILDSLAKASLIQPEDIISYQSATPGAWQFWTKRAFGAVGGYPQYKQIKPWQMKDARLDHKGAYVCGDTVYPGQGIPGVCLSGIIAADKLLRDHF